MGIVSPFRRRSYPRARFRGFRRRGTLPPLPILVLAIAIGMAGYYGFAKYSFSAPQNMKNERFAACTFSLRDNCVVDGDTFYLGGEKIRIADIDAPETGGAQCAYESDLGARASLRLRELLNQGPFELHGYKSRDTDRYGRKLRVVVRDGKSLGDALIAEGLARRWNGRREPWCV
jgi:endonuclease YncB( thermonuclease family)